MYTDDKTSFSFQFVGYEPWTKLYSLNRSLELWETMLMDERTRTITFPSIIQKMIAVKMIDTNEAERLSVMGSSEIKEDQMMLVMILKEIYKTKRHVYRQRKTL